MSNPSNWISLCALVVSLASVGFTLYWSSPIGEVRPLEPSGYAVIRGMDAVQGIGPFPSDHLMLPMQWKNSSGRPTVIQKPSLVLTRISKDDSKESELIFTLAGTYPDISTDSFSKRYSHNNSFLVEPHSVSLNTMVFHIKSYWKEEGFGFRFASDDEFKVSITYVKTSGLGKISQALLRSFADGERTEVLAESLKMHGSLDTLKLEGDTTRKKDDPWWDYWEELTF